jgi:hypothetical protein
MAQQPITDYPIDPVVTSGTQLADILNRTNQVLNSGNSGTSRPPMVTTGGLWVKTGGATPELYMFDGTNDIRIAASSQLDGFVAKSGDTMTGALVVPNATAGNQALNQDTGDARYLNQTSADARYVNVAGDTMTGPLEFANGSVITKISANVAGGAVGTVSGHDFAILRAGQQRLNLTGLGVDISGLLTINGSTNALDHVNVLNGKKLRTYEPGNNNFWDMYTTPGNQFRIHYFTDGQPTIELEAAANTTTIPKISLRGDTYMTANVNTSFVGNGTGTPVVIDGSGFLKANVSSRRYKSDIAPIDAGMDMVMAMTPVKYNLIEGNIPQVGFIAEDFPEPRLVNESLIDPLDPTKGKQVESINYANLTAVLVKAIQELKTEVDALKAAK